MGWGWPWVVARPASKTRLTRGPALGAIEQDWDFEYLVLEGHNQAVMPLSQDSPRDGSDPPSTDRGTQCLAHMSRPR